VKRSVKRITCKLIVTLFSEFSTIVRTFYMCRLNLVLRGGGWSRDKVHTSAARQSVTARNYTTTPSVTNGVGLTF
jgi:hypothetical protein